MCILKSEISIISHHNYIRLESVTAVCFIYSDSLIALHLYFSITLGVIHPGGIMMKLYMLNQHHNKSLLSITRPFQM